MTDTCKRCVMDNTAEDFRLNDKGECNYCTEYLRDLKKAPSQQNNKDKLFVELLEAIKNSVSKVFKNNGYDCIIGVSGGLDSSYVLAKAVENGLKPLAVHLDNGWNSELSVSNIENLVKKLDIDLYTHVIDWNEFKSLQRAFFKAHVIDIELLTDHAIISLCYKLAAKYNIKYILAGTNVANEGMKMPPKWNHFKWDINNIKDIHNKFGDGLKLKTYPSMSPLKYFYYRFIRRIKWCSFLDYVNFDKNSATKELQEKFSYKPYEKKHYESIFTRFYQGYILPKKFDVDKRKLHYSTLVVSGQMTREAAVADLKLPACDEKQEFLDKQYVISKLRLNEADFDQYINSKPIPHSAYKSNMFILDLYRKLKKILKKHETA